MRTTARLVICILPTNSQHAPIVKHKRAVLPVAAGRMGATQRGPAGLFEVVQHRGRLQPGRTVGAL